MAIPVVVVCWGLFFLLRALTGRNPWQVRPWFWPSALRAIGLVIVPGLCRANLILGALLFIVVWPWIWTATVLLRLGALQASAKLAYAASQLAGGSEAKSARLVVMAHHTLLSPERKIAREAAVELDSHDFSGDGSTALCGALIAAGGDNTEAALELFGGVASMRRELAQRWMRALANHVRMTAAAQRGNWSEVLAWSRLGPLTPTSLVFGAAARHCLGLSSSFSNALGWAAWLATPHKVHAWRLLRWAKQKKPATTQGATGLAVLVALQEARPGTVSLAELARGAQSLAALELDDSLHARIAARATELGAQTNGEAEIAQLQAAFDETLTRHLTQLWLPAASYPAVLAPHLESVRLRLFDELEQQLQTLCTRSTPQQLVTGVPLWTMWGRFRTLFSQLWLVFPDSRTLLMGVVEPELTSLGAELYNVERQTSVALDMFALLYGGRKHLDKEAQRRVKANNKI